MFGCSSRIRVYWCVFEKCILKNWMRIIFTLELFDVGGFNQMPHPKMKSDSKNEAMLKFFFTK